MIHAPAIDEFYWGSMEMGAFHLIGNKFSNRKKISVSQNKRGKLRIVSSRSHPSDDIRLLLKKLDIFELVGIGSSLKFCLIAKGEADCYPRLGPTCEWDTAAGEIIAESAGAIVVDTKNNQIQYNKASGFLNPSFIVALNRDLIKELVLMIDET